VGLWQRALGYLAQSGAWIRRPMEIEAETTLLVRTAAHSGAWIRRPMEIEAETDGNAHSGAWIRGSMEIEAETAMVALTRVPGSGGPLSTAPRWPRRT
jgi:hypothetical protein